MTPSYVHAAMVLRVLDGDSLVVRLDLGRYGQTKVEATVPVRVAHINAPDLMSPGAHRAAAEFTRGLLPPGSPILVGTLKASDKYGRTLAHITLPDHTDLGARLIAEGHAVPYEGGVK